MLRPPVLAPAYQPTPAAATGRPLLVAVRSVADVDGALAEAAGRARAARRPLLVAIVLPPRPLTIDAAIHTLHARLVTDLVTALTATVQRRHGDDVHVVQLRQSRRGHGRTQVRFARRLAALADRYGAELHPPSRSWR